MLVVDCFICHVHNSGCLASWLSSVVDILFVLILLWMYHNCLSTEPALMHYTYWDILLVVLSSLKCPLMCQVRCYVLLIPSLSIIREWRGCLMCCQMKQQLHYAWYRMHTSASTDVSDKAKCIGQESRYSVSFVACLAISIVIFYDMSSIKWTVNRRSRYSCLSSGSALAGREKAGMVRSVSGGTRGVHVKLWNPLRTLAVPERLRGVFTTRQCTNPRLLLPSVWCTGTENLLA